MTTPKRLAMLLGLLMLCSLTIPNRVPAKAQAALAESGSAVGTILENTPGNFVLSYDGNKAKFLTERETNYEPTDFRSQAGDVVSVTYSNKKTRDGSFSPVVTKLKLITASPDRREIKSPVTGQIIESIIKWIRLTVPAEKTELLIEKQRSTEYDPKDWKPAVGDKATVHFTRIPSRMANTYVYLIDKIEKK